MEKIIIIADTSKVLMGREGIEMFYKILGIKMEKYQKAETISWTTMSKEEYNMSSDISRSREIIRNGFSEYLKSNEISESLRNEIRKVRTREITCELLTRTDEIKIQKELFLNYPECNNIIVFC